MKTSNSHMQKLLLVFLIIAFNNHVYTIKLSQTYKNLVKYIHIHTIYLFQLFNDQSKSMEMYKKGRFLAAASASFDD